MGETNYIKKSSVFFACTEKKQLITEHIVPDHLLTYVYSGKLSIATADKHYILLPGQSIMFTRNQLAKFTKEPDQDLPYQSATIFFTQDFLQRFYADRLVPAQKAKNVNILPIQPHPLVDNLFQSITGYLSGDNSFLSEELAQLKVKEAITILRHLDEKVDNLLGDFSEPYKIDLANFMQKNFMFNIPLPKFAYLTGRSLATFKRDFKKLFNASPQRWLTERRLQQAHFLIAQQHKKPSEVYLEVGFENLSHFSNSFKRVFGYNSSSVYVSL